MTAYPTSIQPKPARPVVPPHSSFYDPASHSRPGLHFTDHLHLDLRINHTTQTLSCTATLTIRILDPATTHLTLDVRGLDITSVRSTAATPPTPLSYSIEKPDSPIGAALRIALPEPLRASSTAKIAITYTTAGRGGLHPAGGAMDWLPAHQTSSGLPFAFTQAQAIHARSLLPCQDTPAVKATYSALVSVEPPHEHLVVVMSAQRVPPEDGDRADTSRFLCAVPVPSYLVAFACGALECRELSPRCCVWAEGEVVEKAKWEFEEVERMLTVAERVAGEYVWGRYDLLVLPGSFPYGGMENPFLTFVTPTLLSGDRSLVSVVVHEIAHSWAGNLVSCQDCRHFWINEGFTVKLERRILSELYGPAREGLDAVSGRRSLEDFVKSVGANHKYTSLVTKLQDEEDPDDYFSCVPYEKGYNFLMWLEHSVSKAGAGDFHEFLRSYFAKYRYQSVTTTDFIDFFEKAYREVAKKIDFDEWLHGVGTGPPLAPVDKSLAQEAGNLASEWITAFRKTKSLSDMDARKTVLSTMERGAVDFRNWDAKQKLFFLTELKAKLDEEIAEGEACPLDARCTGYLQELYDIDSNRNSEIRFMWCRIALLGKYSPVLDNVKDFVSTQGRMKFIRPLFSDLNKIYPKGSFATDLFAETKPSYHSIASKMIERDLGAA